MLDAEARRRSLIERIAHARETVDRLESAPERLTNGAASLLGVVKSLLHELDRALALRWERLDPLSPTEREAFRRELCDEFQDVLQELGHTLIPVLEQASSSTIPVELETTVQAGVDNAAPAWSLQSVLYGEHRYNYSISLIEDPVGKWGQRLGLTPANGEGHSHFVFLSMPRLERGSMGLHAVVLGHELGHLRDWYERISEGVDLPIPDEFVEEAGGFATTGGPKMRLYRLVATSWISEVVADIFSYLVLGPAAILSLSELTSTLGPPDKDFITHPAPDRRLELMLDLRAQRGATGPMVLDSLLDQVSTDVEGALERPVSVQDVEDQEPCRLAWQWLRNEMPGLVDRCEQRLSEDEVFSADLAEDVDAVSDFLGWGRPAGELLEGDGTPRLVRTRTILNGVWQMKLSRLDELAGSLDMDFGTHAGIRKGCAIIDDLAAKSLEIAAHRGDRP